METLKIIGIAVNISIWMLAALALLILIYAVGRTLKSLNTKIIHATLSQQQVPNGRVACFGVATYFCFESTRNFCEKPYEISELVKQGVQYYLKICTNLNLSYDYLTVGQVVEARVPLQYNGKSYMVQLVRSINYNPKKPCNSLDDFIAHVSGLLDETNHVLINANTYVSGVTKIDRRYQFFDSHNNSKEGRLASNGYAILVELDNLEAFKKYMKHRYHNEINDFPKTDKLDIEGIRFVDYQEKEDETESFNDDCLEIVYSHSSKVKRPFSAVAHDLADDSSLPESKIFKSDEIPEMQFSTSDSSSVVALPPLSYANKNETIIEIDEDESETSPLLSEPPFIEKKEPFPRLHNKQKPMGSTELFGFSFNKPCIEENRFNFSKETHIPLLDNNKRTSSMHVPTRNFKDCVIEMNKTSLIKTLPTSTSNKDAALCSKDVENIIDHDASPPSTKSEVPVMLAPSSSNSTSESFFNNSNIQRSESNELAMDKNLEPDLKSRVKQFELVASSKSQGLNNHKLNIMHAEKQQRNFTNGETACYGCSSRFLFSAFREHSLKDEKEVTDLLKKGVQFYEQIMKNICEKEKKTKTIYTTIFCDQIDEHAPLLYDGSYAYKIKTQFFIPEKDTFVDNIMSALNKTNHVLINSSVIVSGLAKIRDEYCFFDSHGNGKDGLKAQGPDGKAVLIKTNNEQEIKNFLADRYSDANLNGLQIHTVNFELKSQPQNLLKHDITGPSSHSTVSWQLPKTTSRKKPVATSSTTPKLTNKYTLLSDLSEDENVLAPMLPHAKTSTYQNCPSVKRKAPMPTWEHENEKTSASSVENSFIATFSTASKNTRSSKIIKTENSKNAYKKQDSTVLSPSSQPHVHSSTPAPSDKAQVPTKAACRFCKKKAGHTNKCRLKKRSFANTTPHEEKQLGMTVQEISNQEVRNTSHVPAPSSSSTQRNPVSESAYSQDPAPASSTPSRPGQSSSRSPNLGPGTGVSSSTLLSPVADTEVRYKS